MSETGIVLVRARRTRPLAYRGSRTRVPGVKMCATCNRNREVIKHDRHAWFCRGCLDRSRIDDEDDLGGEC